MLFRSDEAYTGLSKQRFKQQQDLEKTFNKDVEEAGGMEEIGRESCRERV